LALVAAAGPASASIVVTFDDLPTPNNDGGQLWGVLPVNYAGLTWTGGWEVADGPTYDSTYNNHYLPPSLNNFAYNDTGAFTVTTADDTPFIFRGAYFSTWAQNDAYQSFSSGTVTVRGYSNNALVASATYNVPSNQFKVESFFDVYVDTLTFQADTSNKWWGMDNFTYDPIPEPATIIIWSLLGMGSWLGMRIVRRRRGGPVGRQPWSPENRQAIHNIIARGAHR
jgi:hypothetical protein